MGKLLLLVLGIVVSTVFVYQSGERKTVQRLGHPTSKVLDASGEFTDEAGQVVKETGDALWVPEAKKKLSELSEEFSKEKK